MTETVSGAGADAATKGQGKGLTMERVFSTEGVHPYDELTWESRDVVQTNWKTGATVFEQRGVEFPATWSVNASDLASGWASDLSAIGSRPWTERKWAAYSPLGPSCRCRRTWWSETWNEVRGPMRSACR